MVPNSNPPAAWGEVAGLAITYRVEKFDYNAGDWVDCEVAFPSPYSAAMFIKYEKYGLDYCRPYRIVDEFMPAGRRVAPSVIHAHVTARAGQVVTSHDFGDEDYRVGPVFDVPLHDETAGRIYD